MSMLLQPASAAGTHLAERLALKLQRTINVEEEEQKQKQQQQQ
jgi:hypothetical protein